MAKRRSLGRGLDALLSQAESPSAQAQRGSDDSALSEVPIDLLERGRYQPRVDMREESLAELAESIRAQGIVQPIVVRPLPNPAGRGEQRYEIVAGERRWRAAQLAGLDAVPAVVRELSDHAALAIALIENIQRENLNPVEEAVSLRRLVDEFDMTHTAVAEAVGRSRAAVSNLLRLLELPVPVRRMLEQRELDMGHARAILGITSAQMQTEIAQRAVAKAWSVRATEQAVRALTAGGSSKRRAVATQKDPDIVRMEQELSERLGAPVEVEHKGRSGRLMIRFHSLEE
ncbi:MAG: ParB/RepB/Spo0J family partition protein, partial [Gammaproteobacteria bacterium]